MKWIVYRVYGLCKEVQFQFELVSIFNVTLSVTEQGGTI